MELKPEEIQHFDFVLRKIQEREERVDILVGHGKATPDQVDRLRQAKYVIRDLALPDPRWEKEEAESR